MNGYVDSRIKKIQRFKRERSLFARVASILMWIVTIILGVLIIVKLNN